MNYFIRRQGWCLDTLNGIVAQMQNPIGIRETGEEQPNAEMVIRWGCTSNLKGNPKVINKAGAIHTVFDKPLFRKIMQKHDLCPCTVFSCSLDDMDSVGYPCVVRPKNHMKAQDFHICHNDKEALAAVKKCGAGYYISSFIDKSAEYRVFVVQGRVASVMRKLPIINGQEIWNDLEEYVEFENWPMAVINVAIAAHNLSGLNFSAADVIVDKKQKAYVLELNTAPEIQSPYRQKCMAKCFDWILTKGREEIPIVNNGNDWRNYIHPAISAAARV